MGRFPVDAMPALPSHILIARLRSAWRTWRRHRRCTHTGWTPPDGCPGCGMLA